MRALRAANRVGLCQFQHSGLNVTESYRPDDTATLIANEIRLAFARVDDQATAAIHVRDIFMGHDWQAVECRVHADMLAHSLTRRPETFSFYSPGRSEKARITAPIG